MVCIHYIPLRDTTLRSIALRCIALRCIALHCVTLHDITLHCIALDYLRLHCTALLYYTTLNYITLRYIKLHYIELHRITLHAIQMYTCNHTNMQEIPNVRITHRRASIATHIPPAPHVHPTCDRSLLLLLRGAGCRRCSPGRRGHGVVAMLAVGLG